MIVWGVLLTGSRSARELRASLAPLHACCEEVVVVVRGCHNGYRGPAGYRGTPLGHLIAALQGAPADVAVVAFVDDHAQGAFGPDSVTRMLDRIEDDMAALVLGAPVTDALKRVEGGTLAGAVERAGLVRPRTPQVLRRPALDRALAEAPDDSDRDPATLLARCGHKVGVVNMAGASSPGGRHVNGSGRRAAT